LAAHWEAACILQNRKKTAALLKAGTSKKNSSGAGFLVTTPVKIILFMQAGRNNCVPGC
jgi:hypothetical protein